MSDQAKCAHILVYQSGEAWACGECNRRFMPMPVHEQPSYLSPLTADDIKADWRMKRRDLAAMAAMQGLLSDPTIDTTCELCAIRSVEVADALIAELDKERPS